MLRSEDRLVLVSSSMVPWRASGAFEFAGDLPGQEDIAAVRDGLREAGERLRHGGGVVSQLSHFLCLLLLVWGTGPVALFDSTDDSTGASSRVHIRGKIAPGLKRGDMCGS